MGTAHVDAVDADNADLPAITVGLLAIGYRVSPERQSRQILLRHIPERLSLLRCVDPAEADLVLLVRSIEDREGIAIGDADDTPDDGLGSRERSDEEAEEDDQGTHTRGVPASSALAVGLPAFIPGPERAGCEAFRLDVSASESGPPYTVRMSSGDHFRPVPRNAFRCPLCGSTAYDHVFVRRGDHSLLQTQAYQCGGCSVMFKDPHKFTEQQQVEGSEQWGVPPRPKNP